MHRSSANAPWVGPAPLQRPVADVPGRLSRISRSLLVLQAFAIFHLLLLALRLLPYRSIARRLLRPPRTARPARQAELAVVEAVADALHLVRRFDYRVREDCLPRSLTVYHLLARRGVPATFRIGVRRDPFGAHAWVEHEERIVGDSPNKTSLYAPLATPARPPAPPVRE